MNVILEGVPAMRLLAALMLMAPVPREPLPEPCPDGYLGVTIRTAVSNGQIEIAEVVEDGPADKAGVRPGDVVVQLGLYQAKDSTELIKRIRSYRPGETATLVLQREGRPQQVRIKLGRRPGDLDPPTPPPDLDK
jgi:S1-C subfamily serine protease